MHTQTANVAPGSRDSHLASDIGGGALGSLRNFGGGTIDLDHAGASIACGQLKRQVAFFPFLAITHYSVLPARAPKSCGQHSLILIEVQTKLGSPAWQD
jgi:hypothetical protein